ncbi:hypothetical protein FA13DRAFT_1727077 [Coprinellus micaceus]|uniref:Uncharacterized protein n=1 Tax=Coprinellus micaceus TaxID=71717 RepID=A0A4Y7TRB1_COPMI|nr:hypothetical protein FA13DRAFT_1727077 [Coprinellus micaceus]
MYVLTPGPTQVVVSPTLAFPRPPSTFPKTRRGTSAHTIAVFEPLPGPSHSP